MLGGWPKWAVMASMMAEIVMGAGAEALTGAGADSLTGAGNGSRRAVSRQVWQRYWWTRTRLVAQARGAAASADAGPPRWVAAARHGQAERRG